MTTKEKIRTKLAEHLGIDAEDILDESIISDELHMKASDITDFIETLSQNGFDTSGVDMTEIETFLDLVEALVDHE